MRSKANIATQIRISRFTVWLVVIVILIFSFGSAWKKVESEADDSAFLVASKRIIERASFYKQQWLLDKQPSTLNIDARLLRLSKNGWLLPLDQDNQVNCQFWLSVLYPEYRILDRKPIKNTNLSEGYYYHCDYNYGDSRHLVIELNNKQFSAKIVFVAE